jgi:hypothetical protein
MYKEYFKMGDPLSEGMPQPAKMDDSENPQRSTAAIIEGAEATRATNSSTVGPAPTSLTAKAR